MSHTKSTSIIMWTWHPWTHTNTFLHFALHIPQVIMKWLCKNVLNNNLSITVHIIFFHVIPSMNSIKLFLLYSSFNHTSVSGFYVRHIDLIVEQWKYIYIYVKTYTHSIILPSVTRIRNFTISTSEEILGYFEADN
jgi:hypothetical protein